MNETHLSDGEIVEHMF